MRAKPLVILLAVIAASCSTAPKQKSEAPVKHAERVRIVQYDSVTRPPTANMEIFDLTRSDHNPIRPYKIIALLTCEGAVQEEPEMLNAIAYRARRLGADCLIIRPPDRTYSLWSTFGERRLFSAQGAVYDDSSK
jgi:hypothetical protein